MAGYECSDKINAFGHRVDLQSTTGHLPCIDEDYQRLSLFNMRTVREGIRWSHVERTPYTYDWSSVKRMLQAGRDHSIQQVWDLCHFGFPDDLTPLHPMFARRFSALCREFVLFYRSVVPEGVLIVTPINEVSFLSWLGGDVRGTSPFCVGQGWEVKYRLMRAYIEGIEALKEVDPTIRILTTEPLVNITASANATSDTKREADRRHEEQFQTIDILSGNMCPELRGKPEYIDLLGFNYYYNNQWDVHTRVCLDWKTPCKDSQWRPLNELLRSAYQRYKRPMVITETSHPREDRPYWIKMIGEECVKTLHQGIPLWGVCWYPIIDRPDWDNLTTWHQSGLWDGACSAASFPRDLNIPAAGYLFKAQDAVKEAMQDVVVCR